MEHLWSPAGATGGNRWQMGPPQKPLKQADPQPVATHGNPFGAHGKEGDEEGPPAESCSVRPRETKGGPTRCCMPDWISAASVSISACSISWARRSRSAPRRQTLTDCAA